MGSRLPLLPRTGCKKSSTGFKVGAAIQCNMAEIDERKILAIIEFLESSDDSSDDEELICILEEHNKPKKPKIDDYVDEVVSKYSEEEFKKNFRVSRKTANNLSREYEESQFFPSSIGGSDTAPACNQILAFLWFVGNKACLRDVASRFGVGESTLHRNCERVMDFLVNIAPRIISFPKTHAEKVRVSQGFLEVSGFPGVLGCIDGSYIPIRTPAHKIKSTYVNRHDQTSITLQGICNSKKEFLDVFVGAPSKIHDSRVFKLSFISRELPAICGERWHVLGDAAYPLREFLLTPYRDYGDPTAAQSNFNRRHSNCRVAIENSFGILKQRFRQLIRLDFLTVDKASKCIMSCCVLHNLCISNDDLWDENNCVIENYSIYNEEVLGEAQLRRVGEAKRDAISAALQIE